ncbi:MAG: zinc ABC transporter substrate-binding protein [Myxococcota bacterium]
MRVWFACTLLGLTAGCESAGGDRPQDDTVRVVTTTTMLRDLVLELGGERVTAQSLVGVGADPHVFQPKPSSARAVANSDLVITSGLGLEGWIDDLVRNAGGHRPVQVASAGVEPIRMEGFKAGVDPHFWFDPDLWAVAATNVAAALDARFSDDRAAQMSVGTNLKRYLRTLELLRGWAAERLGTIPESRRVMVTSHDAFNYLGRAFGLEVVGIQGLSTESEASQRDVATVVDLVRTRKVPAVFIESSVNPALIKKVAAETGIKVLGPLFSDSLGETKGPAGTYVGMFTENVRIVTEGLDGTYLRFEPDAALAGVK